MRVFKTKAFARFCRKSGIEDAKLAAAVFEISSGVIDADLGGGVFKHRISRPGEGKSGGFRSIILFRFEDRAVFVLGFAKKDQDNIETGRLHELRDLAGRAFAFGVDQIEELLEEGRWTEIKYDEEKI